MLDANDVLLVGPEIATDKQPPFVVAFELTNVFALKLTDDVPTDELEARDTEPPFADEMLFVNCKFENFLKTAVSEPEIKMETDPPLPLAEQEVKNKFCKVKSLVTAYDATCISKAPPDPPVAMHDENEVPEFKDTLESANDPSMIKDMAPPLEVDDD